MPYLDVGLILFYSIYLHDVINDFSGLKQNNQIVIMTHTIMYTHCLFRALFQPNLLKIITTYNVGVTQNHRISCLTKQCCIIPLDTELWAIQQAKVE